MSRRSRSTLFLMEQLIVIAVFAICAAACVSILTASYLMARDTRDMSNAVLAAESAAESYKAFSGDLGKTAELLEGLIVSYSGEDAGLVVYYDNHWRPTHIATDAEYILRLTGEPPQVGASVLRLGELSVERITGEEILSFPVAVNAGGARHE